MKNEEKPSAEIVIVRRGGGDEQAGGKGGAWKIAYADFVTAMMAFFLVMWLINASNEETRAQVASYFNPIKLTDSTTGARSLKDTKEVRKSKISEKSTSFDGAPPSQKDVEEEAELMANPPLSIDRIARTVSDSEFRSAGLDSEVQEVPALRPDTANPGVGDPYDPRSWEKSPEAAKLGPSTQESRESDQKMDEQVPSQRGETIEPPNPAESIKRAIEQELDKIDNSLKSVIEVSHAPNGTVISLTDSENFEMFTNGSAKPEPRLLKLFEAVARTLQSRHGNVIIRGHTDSRPYRNKYYDNWQLSTARAHLARYMLMSSGLADSRIKRVEGVADREPKDSKDPQGAVNRRIEILLETSAP